MISFWKLYVKKISLLFKLNTLCPQLNSSIKTNIINAVKNANKKIIALLSWVYFFIKTDSVIDKIKIQALIKNSTDVLFSKIPSPGGEPINKKCKVNKRPIIELRANEKYEWDLVVYLSDSKNKRTLSISMNSFRKVNIFSLTFLKPNKLYIEPTAIKKNTFNLISCSVKGSKLLSFERLFLR